MEPLLFLEAFAAVVSIPASIIFLIERAMEHQKLLGQLLNPKLIGLGIVLASLLFGLTSIHDIVVSPDGLMSSLSPVLLTFLGMDLGLDILFPRNQGL